MARRHTRVEEQRDAIRLLYVTSGRIFVPGMFYQKFTTVPRGRNVSV
jgi:hypothetical protein